MQCKELAEWGQRDLNEAKGERERITLSQPFL